VKSPFKATIHRRSHPRFSDLDRVPRSLMFCTATTDPLSPPAGRRPLVVSVVSLTVYTKMSQTSCFSHRPMGFKVKYGSVFQATSPQGGHNRSLLKTSHLASSLRHLFVLFFLADSPSSAEAPCLHVPSPRRNAALERCSRHYYPYEKHLLSELFGPTYLRSAVTAP